MTQNPGARPRSRSSAPAISSARPSPRGSPPRATGCSAAAATATSWPSCRPRIEAAGGRFEGRSLDARQEDQVAEFLAWADADQPLEVVIFNVGANVNFPILETTERVFRKVWEMACEAGFFTGREAARRMLARGGGSIFFTGATASVRGGVGYAAFASAKAGLRAVAQSMARELGPKNIHVAHLIIDAGVDTAFVRQRIVAARGAAALETLAPDTLMEPALDRRGLLGACTSRAGTPGPSSSTCDPMRRLGDEPT